MFFHGIGDYIGKMIFILRANCSKTRQHFDLISYFVANGCIIAILLNLVFISFITTLYKCYFCSHSQHVGTAGSPSLSAVCKCWAMACLTFGWVCCIIGAGAQSKFSVDGDKWKEWFLQYGLPGYPQPPILSSLAHRNSQWQRLSG